MNPGVCAARARPPTPRCPLQGWNQGPPVASVLTTAMAGNARRKKSKNGLGTQDPHSVAGRSAWWPLSGEEGSLDLIFTVAVFWWSVELAGIADNRPASITTLIQCLLDHRHRARDRYYPCLPDDNGNTCFPWSRENPGLRETLGKLSSGGGQEVRCELTGIR